MYTKRFIIALTLITLLASCNRREQSTKGLTPITGRITYGVPIANTAYPPFQYLEAEKRHELVSILFDAVEAGNLKIFEDEDGRYEMSKERFQNSLHRYFSFNVYENGNIVDVRNDSIRILPKDITELAFLEEWYINPSTFIMTKKVNGIGLAYEDFTLDENGVKTPKGAKALIGWIVFNKK
jgi:hypothetical protein